MTPLENRKQFEKLTDLEFTSDTTGFRLSPDARQSLLNLRAQALHDKANCNSLQYIDNPEALLAVLSVSDVELKTYDFLLNLDTLNTSEK